MYFLMLVKDNNLTCDQMASYMKQSFVFVILFDWRPKTHILFPHPIMNLRGSISMAHNQRRVGEMNILNNPLQASGAPPHRGSGAHCLGQSFRNVSDL